ncbi:ABC transporter permease [Bacillus tianshenii]|nr:ABC transporter permease [Bacillus tianshenii]
MFNANELWKKRFGHFTKEMQRYLRLMFNDHLKFVLLFAGIISAYYYQQWLQGLPETFPTVFIMAIVLGVLLTHSPVRTLLKEADVVFLIPLEERLGAYFQKAKQYSFTIQCYVLLIAAGVLAPLYFHTEESSFGTYALMIGVLFVVKGWNIYTSWQMRYFSSRSSHYSDMVVRFTVNVVFVYFLFAKAAIWFLLMVAFLMLGLFFYYRRLTDQKKVLKWEQLIELEQGRMMTFYRIANMFTDVPKFKEKTKRRAYLSILFSRIPFKQTSTFVHLYTKTFIRSSDYLGIYVRLLVIGGIVAYTLPYQYGKLIVLLLTLYLSGFQLLPLWRHHVMKRWLDLYPIRMEVRMQSFLKVLFSALLVKAVILAVLIMLSGGLILGAVSILLGIGFSAAFVYFYTKKRLQRA